MKQVGAISQKIPVMGWLLALVPVFAFAADREPILISESVREKLQSGEDPGDAYLSAYRLCREAEALAQRKRYNAALHRGQQAERILATIVRDHPNWKKNLLEMRRRLLAESMARYRQEAKKNLPESQQDAAGNGTRTARDLQRELQGGAAQRGREDRENAPGGERRPPFDAPRYEPTELPNYDTTRDRRLYNALARAQEECRRMAQAYSELNTRFTEVQKSLLATQMEKNHYKERYEKLKEQVATERAAGNSVVDSLSRQLEEMANRCRQAENDWKQATARADELEKKLTQTQKELERVAHERDVLAGENEKLRAVVELNSPEKTRALLDQNLTLAEQLKAAQEKIEKLEAQQAGADDQQAVLVEELERTRAEAARLREELQGIYDENMGYRRRISELTEQLNNLEADLAAREKIPSPDPALQEEIRLLHGVIEKQRGAIAMQEQSRKLLIETYSKLKNNDPNVEEALRRMQEESNPGLTESERRMLEDIRRALDAEKRQKSPETERIARTQLEVRTLARLAQTAFDRGRYESAEQMYLTLYDLQPDHVGGLVNLGTVLLYNNKSEEALTYLRRAMQLAPKFPIVYYLAGIALYREEQLAEAQAMFTRAVQLDPGNAEAFFYLANIESLTGNSRLALKHFAAAVKIDSSLADAHYNMARLYAETGRLADAARSYDRAVHDGAAPDPDLELFLRRNNASTKRPGADLVSSIRPEDEAKKLPVPENWPGETEEAAPAANPQDEAQAEGTAAAGKPQDDFLLLLEKTAQPVEAAVSPSPAGAGHETAPERFSTIRIRTRRHGLVPLRLKRPNPRQLRTRGEEKRE